MMTGRAFIHIETANTWVCTDDIAAIIEQPAKPLTVLILASGSTVTLNNTTADQVLDQMARVLELEDLEE